MQPTPGGPYDELVDTDGSADATLTPVLGGAKVASDSTLPPKAGSMSSLTSLRAPGRSRKFRRSAAAVAVLIGVALATVVGWWLFGGAHVLQASSLADRISAYAANLDAKLETQGLCISSQRQCEEGWSTKVGDYLRFDSAGQAEYWELVLGDDGRRNGNLLLDMTGRELSLNEKQVAIDILFAERDWW